MSYDSQLSCQNIITIPPGLDHFFYTERFSLLFIRNRQKDTHMRRQKGIDNALAITKRNAPLIIFPIERRVGRVGPYEVIQQPIVWYVYTLASSTLRQS